MWVAGVLVFLLVLSSLRRIVAGPPGTVALVVVGMAGSVLSWWWTARLMLRGEVRWRPLLPTAVVTGVGVWAYTLAATVWMPRAVAKHYAQFGSFGIALDFMTWFTGFSFLVIGAAVLAPVLAEGDNVLGRWLLQGQPSPLEPSAAPSTAGSATSPAPFRCLRSRQPRAPRPAAGVTRVLWRRYSANTSASFASCALSRFVSISSRMLVGEDVPDLGQDGVRGHDEQRARAGRHLVANAVDEVVVDPDVAHRTGQQHPWRRRRLRPAAARRRGSRAAGPRTSPRAPGCRRGRSAGGSWASWRRAARTRSQRRGS